MRRALLLILTVTLSLAAQTTTAPATQPRDEAGGKALIQKIIEAHGGAKAFAAIKSTRTTVEAGPRHTATTIVLPDRLHGEMETRATDPKAPAKKNISIVGPDGAWYFDGTWHDLPAQNRAATLRFALSNFALLLHDADSGKYHFAITGSEMFEGKPASVLEIDGPENLKIVWVVDPESGEILARNEGIMRIVYDNWQTVAGIRLPTHARSTNSKTNEMTESKIKYEINPVVDEKEFAKPEMPPTTGPATKP